MAIILCMPVITSRATILVSNFMHVELKDPHQVNMHQYLYLLKENVHVLHCFKFNLLCIISESYNFGGKVKHLT